MNGVATRNRIYPFAIRRSQLLMRRLVLFFGIMGLALSCSPQPNERPALPTAMAGVYSGDIVYTTPGAKVTRAPVNNGPTSTPAPFATALPPTPLPPAPEMEHPVEGNEDCFNCHYRKAYYALPLDHARRSLTTCLGCHRVQDPYIIPQITHEIAGRESCLMCHLQGKNGAPVEPGDHGGRLNDSCIGCHKPKQ